MKTKINRRKFIQQSALGSAGAMLTPAFVSSNALFANPAGSKQKLLMSGITPVSVIDSACMLAYRSGKLSPSSEQIIISDMHMRDVPGDKGRLAVIFPPGSIKLIELVRTIKTNPETKHAKQKRVLAFGWAAVNAVDKNINRALKNMSADELEQTRMHQDAVVIQNFSLPEFDITKAGAQDMEDLLNSMLVRTTTRVHTYKPDSDDGIGWVNRMTDWRKQYAERMKTYARILVSPDVAKAGESFYNSGDGIISAADKLQKAQNVQPEKIEGYLREKTSSDYAKAMTEATVNILAINSYLEDKLTEKKLTELLGLT